MATSTATVDDLVIESRVGRSVYRFHFNPDRQAVLDTIDRVINYEAPAATNDGGQEPKAAA